MKKYLILTAFIASILTLSACGNEIENRSSATSSSENISSVVSESKAEENKAEENKAEDSTSADESIFEESTADENSADETSRSETVQNEPVADDEKGRILVAYFTFPEDGSDADAGASRVVTADGEIQGNVEYFAKIIAEETGADLFQIQTVQQYPGDHEPLVDMAAEERDNGARPELASHIENLDDYDTIFIGYPIWWYDMPMAMNTFFEEYDFSGKTIVPFSSHGGSGFSTSIDDIAGYEPDAEILEGFTVERNDVPASADDLRTWISGLGI